MNLSERNGVLYVEDVKDFRTDHIFDCGQCFRWKRDDEGRYTGTAFGKCVRIGYDEDESTVVLEGSSEEDFHDIWKNYLDLDRDYSGIKRKLSSGDEVMAEAVSYGSGIRILNQEKWETLISFIISQNNNIPRIKKCIGSLAQTLGEKTGSFGGEEFYSLPGPEKLASAGVDALGPCRLGYRAKYLVRTAEMVAEEGMESLERLGDEDMPSEETFEALRRYPGVGPKVANCIALFSMGKLDRFPIDVWVRKVMNRLYGLDEDDMKGMARFAADRFGKLGGIAQQYLFYYITHNKEI